MIQACASLAPLSIHLFCTTMETSVLKRESLLITALSEMKVFRFLLLLLLLNLVTADRLRYHIDNLIDR